ncbi:CPBP family intramembrane glutamic endopeptidase [Rhizobium glycinendophyticum]|uniref:CPBP family intramembrane metalloprotease n=1 Tax=Rhizobium glycinendophyticum TaxID=2589807 RepID=A0A504USQ5_9HYPH|nr:CPBP family intramembrane glutamic endopeptidase [Rhizobium glycinendophyticum]TPP09751.1 CPBP family intramembrane metalloprotease [Rhizobium glycinendophyticum]
MAATDSSQPASLQRRLATFYGVTLGVSWSWWGWMFFTGQMVEPGSSASHLPGLAGPLVGAIISTAVFDGKAGLRELLGRGLRIPRRPWLALALILLPLLLLAFVILVGHARGEGWPAVNAFFDYPGVPSTTGWLMSIILVLLLNGFGEEVGWRGYAFERLVAERSALRATLWVSLLWLVWHLPLFFVHRNMAEMIGPALLGWAIGLLLGAFVLSWLYLSFERSILVCALWHTAYNFAVATPAGGNLAPAVISTVVMFAGLWAAWVLRESQKPEPR